MSGDRRFALVLLTPALLCVVGLVGWPMAQVLGLSFVEGRGIDLLGTSGVPRVVGWGNYAAVFAEPETWESVLTTILYVAGSIVPSFLLGLGAALLLNQRFPLRRALRCLALLPWAAPGVLVSIVFLWLFDPSYGVVNYLLRETGVSASDVGWFIDEDTALAAVIVTSVWKSFPFFALTILGALQTIPAEFYEAAEIDGAGRLDSFRHVTWPGIRGPAVLAVVLNSLWALREFDIIFATTGGGPVRATETLGIRAYVEVFSNFELGRGCALGVLTIAMALVVVLAARRPLQREFF